ncbi:MAG TPA: phosphate/phosphite/phosphonate ABC transporter substrate-binding protein [Paenibacillus sp.]|nr:phosphate/phosphite/phosphonate ABC transporter substrate-binding protein [Paenibacillus sp.]
MNRMYAALATAFSLMAFAPGCATENEPLTIGLVPSSDPAAMIERFAPIEAYLEQELERPVDTVVTEHYAGLIERMKAESVDIGWYGAFSYTAAQAELELEPMVIQRREGSGLFYHSVIVTRSDSDFASVEDLEGASFAFVDRGSTSGFIIPYALFKSRGIEYERFFGSVAFSGTHDSVLEDVMEGDADAGVLEDLTLQKWIASDKLDAPDVRVLWQSEPLPGSPFAARASLKDGLKSEFREAMIAIHEKDPSAMKRFDERIERFEPFEDALYKDIRNISTILGKSYVLDNFLNN